MASQASSNAFYAIRGRKRLLRQMPETSAGISSKSQIYAAFDFDRSYGWFLGDYLDSRNSENPSLEMH
jgi:hypothetical protein